MKKIIFLLLFLMISLSGYSQILNYRKPDSTYVMVFNGTQASVDSIHAFFTDFGFIQYISPGKAYLYQTGDTILTGQWVTLYIDPQNGNARVIIKLNPVSVTTNHNTLYEYVYDKVQAYAKKDSIDLVMTRHDADSAIASINSSLSSKLSTSTTTTSISEGSNKYYTDSRARASISLTTTGSSGSATYNSSTGVFNVPNYTSSTTVNAPSTGNTFTSGTAFQPNSSKACTMLINASLSGIVGVNGTVTIAMSATGAGAYTTIASDAIAIAILGAGNKSIGTFPVPAGYWVKITLAGSTAPTATYTKWDF